METPGTSGFGTAAYGGPGWSPRSQTHADEIGTLWRGGIDSEWRPLKTVLLRRPGSEIVVEDIRRGTAAGHAGPVLGAGGTRPPGRGLPRCRRGCARGRRHRQTHAQPHVLRRPVRDDAAGRDPGPARVDRACRRGGRGRRRPGRRRRADPAHADRHRAFRGRRPDVAGRALGAAGLGSAHERTKRRPRSVRSSRRSGSRWMPPTCRSAPCT